MRALGASPYALRRTLLWSAETQVPHITNESGRRTEMVQAQIVRETTRKRLSRAEFLDTLNVGVTLFGIRDVNDHRLQRTLKLINKSDQFNTTGNRWTRDECQTFFRRRGTFWAFEVEDRFTRYGVVGVAIIAADRIEQFVMSCRIIGLDVENAVIFALDDAAEGKLTAAYTATDTNFLCSDLMPNVDLRNMMVPGRSRWS